MNTHPVPRNSEVSDVVAPDGGLVSLLAKEGDQAVTYSGHLIDGLLATVDNLAGRGDAAAIGAESADTTDVPRVFQPSSALRSERPACYSRPQLERELFDMKDAHSICYFRLIALRDAEQETFLKLFNVANQILIRYAEVKQTLKGVCCCCDFTPCQCPTTGEPDDAVHDVQREWGVGR